ncbi:condensation domain-containing protein [Novispirillum itersonii]|uniref:Acyl-CoA synthetase (AMP-forming)/AMP-acid ligase II n=1 Tax=Novispirillum itersonii TaxID=189 RepID=A0A7W9ZIK4_NOVIT|nr:condensation domain-containing protein [Novispirillum itersonii]MBB6212153.1 acyl-CoA synthetase (AMP-forming)/AMP-acid ligase II [Novispirillum itersonii]
MPVTPLNPAPATGAGSLPATLPAYLSALTATGVCLTADGDRLKVQAPPGVVDDRTRRILSARRGATLALLSGQHHDPILSTLPLAPPTTAPLTPWQEGFWLMHQREDADLGTLHVHAVFRLDGPVEVPRLQQAVTALAERQTALRLRFRATADGGAEQWVSPDPLALDGITVSGTLSDEELDALCADRIRQTVLRRFDLTQDPAVRLQLISAGPDRHRLLFVAHHLVLDGWSVGLFLRDLVRLYAGETLPPLPFCWLDYARSVIPTGAGAAAIAAEAERVAALPLCHELPTDTRRGEIPAAPSGESHFRLDAATVTALRQKAADHGGGLYAALLTGFQAVYRALSGERAVPVMAPVANRQSSAVLEDLIGCCANGVIIAPALPAAPTVGDALRRIAAEVVTRLDRQDLPFDAVIAAAGLPRLPATYPGAQIFFALQDAGTVPSPSPDLTVTLDTIPVSLGRQDLLIEFRPATDGSLLCRVNRDGRLFSAETTDALAALLCGTLNHLAPLSADAPLDEAVPAPPVQTLTADVAVTAGTLPVNRGAGDQEQRLSLPGTGDLLRVSAGPGPWYRAVPLRPDLSCATPPGLPGRLRCAGQDTPLTVRIRPADGDLEVWLSPETARQIPLRGGWLDLDQLAARLLDSPLIADAALSVRGAGDAAMLVIWVVPALSVPVETLRSQGVSLLGTAAPLGPVVRLSALPRCADGTLDRHRLSLLPVTALDVAQRAGLDRHALLHLRPEATPRPRQPLRSAFPSRLPPGVTPVAVYGEGAPQTPASQTGRTNRPPARAGGMPLPESYPSAGWSPLDWLTAAPQTATLRCRDVSGPDMTIPYPHLLQQVRALVGWLLSQTSGHRLPILLATRSVRATITAFLAAMAAGCPVAPLPVPRLWQADDPAVRRIASLAGLTGASCLLTDMDVAALPDSLSSLRLLRLPDPAALEASLPLSPTPPEYRWQEDEQALFAFTSGSTGSPKGVPLTAGNLFTTPAALAVPFGFQPGETVLNLTGLDHVASLISFCGTALRAGASLGLLATERFLADPGSVARTLSDWRVARTWAPDFAWSLIADTLETAPVGSLDLSAFITLFSGGECPLAATFHRLRPALMRHGAVDPTLRTAWGMAETTSVITLSDGWQETGSTHLTAGGVLDSGRPLPGAEARIVGPDGNPLPEGETGRFEIRGPGVFHGYSAGRDPDAVDPDGWLRTGDLGWIRDGRIMILGREKDVLILNGQNVAQAALEDRINALDGVEPGWTAVTASRDRRQGRMMLTVFFHPRDQQPDDTTLTALLRRISGAIAAGWGVHPDVILPLPKTAIAKTGLGKLQRTLLRLRYEAGEWDALSQRMDLLLGNDRTLPRALWQWRWHPLGTASAALTDGQAEQTVLLPGTGDAAERLTAARTVIAAAQGAPRRLLWLDTPDTHALGAAVAAALVQEYTGVRAASVLIPPGPRTEARQKNWLEECLRQAVPPQDTALRPGDAGLEGRRLFPAPDPQAEDWTALPAGACLLVTGGLGAVGRTILPTLLSWTDWRFLVVGRRAETAVADQLETLRQGFAPDRLSYHSLDACDAAALTALCATTRPAGALLLAGRLDRTPLEHCTASVLAEHTNARLQAATAIEQAFSDAGLTGTAVHVTSVYGVVGRRDFAAYSLSSALLEDWISRRPESGPVRHVALQCGQWQPEDPDDPLARHMRSQGFGSIDGPLGATAVLRALLGPHCNLVVGPEPEGSTFGPLTPRPAQPLDRVILTPLPGTDPGRLMAAAAAHALPVRLEDSGAASVGDAALSPTGQQVMALWREVLPAGAPVEADINFFDVGGTSLLAARLHLRLRETFGTPDNVVALFSHTTVRAQTALITGAAAPVNPPASAPTEPPAARTPLTGPMAARRRAARAQTPEETFG